MKNKIPNLIILNPYSQGFFVFTKLAEGNCQRLVATNHAREIFHIVGQLPRPRLTVHIGRAYDSFLGQLIFQETDFCTIPMAWMSHIPFQQVNARAQFAVQLTEAYLNDPIRLFGAKEPSD